MFGGLDPGTLMLLAGIAVGAGIAGGVLAGLLGVGGGIVIVPALYLSLSLTGMDPALIMQVAVGTSLSTIVFTSLSSGIGHYRQGAIDFDLLKLWAPSILVGVVIGSVLGGVVSGLALLAVFATVALIVSFDMMFRKGGDGSDQRSFSRPVWAGLGTLAGAISAMMGIGGGTVCVPLLNFLGYDIRRAVGTSSAIGFLIGVPGAIIYAISGLGQDNLPPFSLGYVNLLLAAIIIPLSTSFAHLGVRLAHAIPRGALRMAFGLFLLATSLRMFWDLFTT
ncbi:sulfite exporter TauE/SafE family protein [Maribius pontilimi]|uniref:Probable membrane transporter protein n=1 Tax=Palleronia pontilimi TaxID=1964209 RepID=A0A934IJU3_9RHOB|nr:sulfite exporter TauE/SafE family protein [Palleronia pontilimi]MBJ3764261.1 sulfite exporter TauE/SafE family protein [Palleronia pontilimi]